MSLNLGATRGRGRGLGPSCGPGQRGRGTGRGRHVGPTPTSTTTSISQQELDLVAESSTSSSVSEPDDEHAQASSLEATRATASTTRLCSRMSSVRASCDDMPLPNPTSRFNLSTVRVGNVAIVRRDDQGASSLVTVIIVCLLCSLGFFHFLFF